ncbi:arylamine N-acetyltransferase [Pseudanabaenaceae cyanobacterium LEGE 13415]|nr:arylamine N-acetyltransferase [Pseudanabaenaceae cyanobacterium LEGE 13415]
MKHLPEIVNLDAYFQRIDYQGDTAPTLETLKAIHLKHATTIAFENLNPLLKRPVLLDPDSLEKKLIHQRRGGYCFEQNLLLRSVLIALGFRVTNLAARVVWNLPEDTMSPRTHMLLRVEIDRETYLADVGFGGITQTAPLALTPDIEQTTPHEPFRLIQTNDTYTLQAKLGEKWKSLYRFDLQEQYFADYEVSNWYVSTHPNSRFVTTLIAARPDVDRRYALLNNQLTLHYLDGRTERQHLSSVKELRTVLEDCFQLQLPTESDLDRVLVPLIQAPETAPDATPES